MKGRTVITTHAGLAGLEQLKPDLAKIDTSERRNVWPGNNWGSVPPCPNCLGCC